MRLHRSQMLLQLLALALPAAWVASRYGRTYYFYDEWSLIGYAISHAGLHDAFLNFNGHLWLFPYLLYKAQAQVFGLEGHALVWSAFCLSLLALAAAVRWLLVELGVPSWPATAGALVVGCFGPAGQNLVFEVQVGPMSAYALSLAAVGAGLRWRGAVGTAVASGMLLLATGCDSSAALLALAYAVPLLVLRRPQWSTLLLLVPPVLLAGGWYLSASRGPMFDAEVTAKARFAARLLLLAAGGVAGGGAVAGAVLLAAVGAALVVGLRRGSLSGLVLMNAAAAALAAGATVGAVAETRTGIAAAHLDDYNRYLGQVALFLLVGALPVLASRPASAPGHRWTSPALSCGLLVVLVLNTRPLLTYRERFEAWTQQTRAGVIEATAQISQACPPGTELLLDTRPLGVRGPQVTVALLQQLMKEGRLAVRKADFPPRRGTVEVCTPVP